MERIDSTRRKVTKVAAMASWMTPLIYSVSLPSHAQTSEAATAPALPSSFSGAFILTYSATDPAGGFFPSDPPAGNMILTPSADRTTYDVTVSANVPDAAGLMGLGPGSYVLVFDNLADAFDGAPLALGPLAWGVTHTLGTVCTNIEVGDEGSIAELDITVPDPGTATTIAPVFELRPAGPGFASAFAHSGSASIAEGSVIPPLVCSYTP